MDSLLKIAAQKGCDKGAVILHGMISIGCYHFIIEIITKDN